MNDEHTHSRLIILRYRRDDMIRLTKAERAARFRPVNHRQRWFYLTQNGHCSFHEAAGVGNDTQQDVHGISVTVLLRALQQRGFLRQWDRKQQVLRKVTR